MEEDFELIINDDVYHVKTPELERPSQVNRGGGHRGAEIGVGIRGGELGGTSHQSIHRPSQSGFRHFR